MMFRLLAGMAMVCSLAWGQQLNSSWEDELRKLVSVQDWAAAMRVVDRELARTPQDMDVRAWRARILTWSGSLAEAEAEYGTILAAVLNDPDNWMGLANVYSREGRVEDALRALNRAVELDPKRADLRAAHARALQIANRKKEAKLEFEQAITLDPTSKEAHAGLISLREKTKHELRVGTDVDLFNFTDSNQAEGLVLISQWNRRWGTSLGGATYQRGGVYAQKFLASVAAKSSRWGALTVGGAAAHDNGVIPKSEAFLEYDHGRKLGSNGLVRGLEIVYGQHWYWYTTARVLTLNETTLLYLPHDWTYSLGVTGAQSTFYGTGREWRPSGTTRLSFPLAGREVRRLSGNVFFAVGTENFAQVDQIGSFSSHTYGAGLRFQFATRQEVAGYAAYQQRSHERTQTSFGLTYAVRF